MDATRLVAEAERTMRRCPQPQDVIAEAWQAYELTEAVGSLLAGRAQPERGARAGFGGPQDRGTRPGREAWPDREALSGNDGAGGSAFGGCWPGGSGYGGPRSVESGARIGAATGAGPPRAARLTGVRDAAGTLRALRVLLGDIGLALVGLTSAAEDEAAYWQCIEALDAVDEAKDRVRALAMEEAG